MCLGIPGRIVQLSHEAGLPMGVVDFGGVRREVCLAYVADEIDVGDYAIIHVGFAISKVDEEEARRTYAVLREMGELEELEWIREAADAAEAVDVPSQGAERPEGPAGSAEARG
jgi:hydrogenase expression/formation protein HypC